jgi:hypothetical protein
LGRVLLLTKPYLHSRSSLGIAAGTDASRAVSATLRQLLAASGPLPGDVEAYLTPVASALVQRLEGRTMLTAFVRRVPGRALWVWYRPRVQELELVLLTTVPPIPTA